MIRRPPRSTRTYTLVPYTTLFRSGDIVLGVEVVLAEGSMRRTCCPSAAEKCGWGATHSPWNAISVWCPMTSGKRLYACLPGHAGLAAHRGCLGAHLAQ